MELSGPTLPAEAYFILGGTRSGKSRLAQRLGEFFISEARMKGQGRFCRKGLFLATARALDQEMASRIEQHQRERRAEDWDTREEPLDPAGQLADADAARYCVVLLDCITLWLSNLMMEGAAGFEDIKNRVDGLGRAVRNCRLPVILVSNEVGAGVVPADEMARNFRDMAGFTNQALAAVCENVIFTVSGLPLVLKGSLPNGFSP